MDEVRDIGRLKQELRQQMVLTKRSMEVIEKEIESTSIWKQIESSSFFQEARTILLFHSLPDEPFSHTFIARWANDKRLLLPVVDKYSLRLRIYTPTTPMSKGAFQINEPMGVDFEAYEEIDLAIIPGVAFDKEGNRLGRGKGYYDRLLAHPKFNAYCIGVCFSKQIVLQVPCEEADRKMQMVITGKSD